MFIVCKHCDLGQFMIKNSYFVNKRSEKMSTVMRKRYLQKFTYAAALTTATMQAQAASTVDFSDLVEQVSPAVVSVNVVKKLTQEELLEQQVPEILKRFFGNQIIIPEQKAPQAKQGFGSAFFISKDGYLLTNHHVVDNASKITIVFNDRRELDATLVGSDARTDVALLKVEGNQFPELRSGNVDKLRVGEPVLAIGSPFGFDYSASAGIVSAKMRNMMGETTVPFIQTDVALNPGNSGGPLFNQKGEVVGVNSRIFTGTGGYMGLSFSIPIDVAMDVADQLKKQGKVTRAYLGVSLQDIDRTLAEAYKLSKPEGSLITQIQKGSPAERAGLKVGDIILAFNGTPISRTANLLNYLNRVSPQQTINLDILRNDKRQKITATLTTAPDETPSTALAQKKQDIELGAAIRDLSSAELQSLKISGGILIQELRPNGNAQNAGLEAGDILVQLNDTPIRNVTQFIQIMNQVKKGSVIRVTVLRQGQPLILGMRIS